MGGDCYGDFDINDRSPGGFRGGQIPPLSEGIHEAVNEMVRRQVKAREEVIEKVLLDSLATGQFGVLVIEDRHSGDVTASVDSRVPYATIVYMPPPASSASRLFPGFGELPKASELQMRALLQHLARKLLDRG